jgi:thiamine-phosphate diphosphorylase
MPWNCYGTGMNIEGLYAVVDMPHAHGLSAAAVTRAVLGDRLQGGRDGAAAVQLRAKQATTEARVEMLAQMAPLCGEAGVPLIVNDDLEAVRRGPAEVVGIHLGQDDPGALDVAGVRGQARAFGRPNLMVGLSTHDARQFRQADRQRPDYLALGPIAATRTKQNPGPIVGFDRLLEACRMANRPVVAIGGLEAAGGARAITLGASAVAVVGALTAPSPAEIARRASDLARRFRQAAAQLSLDEVAREIPVLSREQLRELATWSTDLGVLIELGLPARFRPRIVGEIAYRPCDVLDVMFALGKRAHESWEQWSARMTVDDLGDSPAVLVRLRTLGATH